MNKIIIIIITIIIWTISSLISNNWGLPSKFDTLPYGIFIGVTWLIFIFRFFYNKKNFINKLVLNYPLFISGVISEIIYFFICLNDTYFPLLPLIYGSLSQSIFTIANNKKDIIKKSLGRLILKIFFYTIISWIILFFSIIIYSVIF